MNFDFAQDRKGNTLNLAEGKIKLMFVCFVILKLEK